MKIKIKRKEFYIVEVYRDAELDIKEWEEMCKSDEKLPLDEQSSKQELFDEWIHVESNLKFTDFDFSTNELIEKEFNIPEQSEYLGHIDIVEGESEDVSPVIINCDIKPVIREGVNLLDFKTFYWDYSSLDRFNDINNYLRDFKIKKLLKDFEQK